MRLQWTLISLAAALGTLLLVACSSSSPPPQQSAAVAPQDAVVSSINGNTTIFMRGSDPDEPIMMSTSGGPVCPECKAAAIKYFKTGVLDPHCTMTGATRTLATPIVIPSHN